MKHLRWGLPLVLLLAVAVSSQEVQTVRSAQTFWKYRDSYSTPCNSGCNGYFPAVACGIVGCQSCSVYGRYWGARSRVPRGADAPQSCGCAMCDSANGFQLLADGSCGCRSGYGSYIQLAPGTMNPSNLPTMAPSCPSWGGYYYPYTPTRRYVWSHRYPGNVPMSSYAGCRCFACPTGYTSAGGSIGNCGCFLSSPIPTPQPSPSPALPPPPPASPSPAPTPPPDASPSPDPGYPDYPPETPTPPESPAPGNGTEDPYYYDYQPEGKRARAAGATRIQNILAGTAKKAGFGKRNTTMSG